MEHSAVHSSVSLSTMTGPGFSRGTSSLEVSGCLRAPSHSTAGTLSPRQQASRNPLFQNWSPCAPPLSPQSLSDLPFWIVPLSSYYSTLLYCNYRSVHLCLPLDYLWKNNSFFSYPWSLKGTQTSVELTGNLFYTFPIWLPPWPALTRCKAAPWDLSLSSLWT